MAKTKTSRRKRTRKPVRRKHKRLSRRELNQAENIELLMTPEPFDFVSIIFGDAANTMFTYSPTEKVLGGPATTANQFARLLTTACRRYGAPIGKVSHSRIHHIVGFGEWSAKPKEVEAIFAEYLRRTGCTSVQKIKMSETKR